jgi:glycerol-3-phosphate acyltransferase PlsY
MHNALTLIFIVGAYLLGSVSSAILVCKAFGLADPRTLGSNNPGATNVLRIGGKIPALLTLLGDLAKGLVPVFLARLIIGEPTVTAITALAAFLGHLYPLYFSFRGGKGVATFLGCLIALNLPTAIAWGIVWLVIAIIFRYASLASLVASIAAIFLIQHFTHLGIYAFILLVMTILLLIRHRQNIRALMNGTENKIGKKVGVN